MYGLLIYIYSFKTSQMQVFIAILHYDNTSSGLTYVCAYHSIKIHVTDKNIRKLLEEVKFS